MSLKYAIALVVFFVFASVARADKMDVHVSMSKTDFDAVRNRMTAQLDSNTDITPKDKAAVIEALNRIDQRLAKSTMDDQDLMETYNDQELINQITTHAKEESRLSCRRNHPTGSHVMRVTCMSLGDWTKQEKDAQTAMRAIVDDNHRSHCPTCIYDTGADPYGH